MAHGRETVAAIPLLVVILLCVLQATDSNAQGSSACTFLVGAFNIQVLGVSKVSKAYIVDELVKILRRYDAVLIQEVRDVGGTALVDLVTAVNTTSRPYNYVISERLGRTSSKEQYVLLYRSDRLAVLRWYVHNDSSMDVFEREPLVAELAGAGHYAACFIERFSIIGVHIKPSAAAAELNALVAVYNTSVSTFGNSNSLIMGDMNADCSYLSNAAASSVQLFTDPRFDVLINKSVDTTVAVSACAYDRIIAAGTYLKSIIAPNSVSIYRYDVALGLNQSVAEDVSDHYPVELTLATSVSRSLPTTGPPGSSARPTMPSSSTNSLPGSSTGTLGQNPSTTGGGACYTACLMPLILALSMASLIFGSH